MKEEFDLNKIGKNMPYQVPSGFFEEISAQTLAEAKRRSHSTRAFSIVSWQVLSIAASVVLLLLAGYLFLPASRNQTPHVAQVAPAAMTVPQAPEITETTPSPPVVASPEVAAVSEPAQTKKPAKLALPAPVPPKAKPEKTETLDQLLASISDDDLQQLAALAESEEFVYGETIEQ
ncbi:hypothetical protein [Rufibacter soli]